MSDLEKRVEALELAVANVPKRGRWATCYERDLREAALQYARVGVGFFVESDGQRVPVTGAEAKELEELFLRRMRTAARDLLRELSIEER